VALLIYGTTFFVYTASAKTLKKNLQKNKNKLSNDRKANSYNQQNTKIKI